VCVGEGPAEGEKRGETQHKRTIPHAHSPSLLNHQCSFVCLCVLLLNRLRRALSLCVGEGPAEEGEKRGGGNTTTKRKSLTSTFALTT